MGRLDPSIRKKLQKRGISIIQSIYAGFDMEYWNIGLKNNQLLSVQLAVIAKMLIKVPFLKSYELSSLDPLTGEVMKLTKVWGFDYEKMERCVNWSIYKIRSLKYNKQYFFTNIDRRFEISFFEKNDLTVFSLPRSVVKRFIFYNNGSDYTLEDLVKQVNDVGIPMLDKDYKNHITL